MTTPGPGLRERIAQAIYYSDHDAYVQPPWRGNETPGAVGCYLAADAVLAEMQALEDQARRVEAALAALVEAVSRGDEYGLPEAYRAARRVLAGDPA